MNEKIYLDNASSTNMRIEVKNKIINFLNKENIVNPSSIHSLGIKSKTFIEKSRILVSNIINADPSEIFFTSSGTESNNLIILSSVINFGIKRIVTSPLEHVSILNTIYFLKKKYNITIEMVKIKKNSDIDLQNLEYLLSKKKLKTLVSLMSINNEIGNILRIEDVGNICKKYNSFYHSDMIQSIGHYKLNVKKLYIHFISASAHKFYGPHGIGFIFIKKNINLKSIFFGGKQENNLRPGIENIIGIIGLSKALILSYKNLKLEKKKIEKLKYYTLLKLKKEISDIYFNGFPFDFKKSSYSIINFSFPIKKYLHELIEHKFDLYGICISRGSACNNKKSHVIKFLHHNKKKENFFTLRISLGIFNKKKDIDFFLEVLKKIIL